MHKFPTLVAGVVLLGFGAAANASDQPAELTADEMDVITAGDTSGGGVRTRTISLGAYSLVFDGRRWSIVFNR